MAKPAAAPPLPTLASPSPELLDAYLDFCRESWGHVHEEYILHDPAKFGEWRETIFDELRRAENGTGLAPGIVPSVTYWLTLGGRVVGVANLRKRLNETLERYGGHLGLCLRPSERGKGYASSLLPLLFAEAGRLGIREVLVTTTAENLPSRRVNESQPGCRSEEAVVTLHGRPVRIFRYRHSLS